MAVVDTRRPKSRSTKGQSMRQGIAAANTGVNLAALMARVSENQKAREDRQAELALAQENQRYNRIAGLRDKSMGMWSKLLETIRATYGANSPEYKRGMEAFASNMEMMNSPLGANTPADGIAERVNKETVTIPILSQAYSGISDLMGRIFNADNDAKAKKAFDTSQHAGVNILADSVRKMAEYSQSLDQAPEKPMTAEQQIKWANVVKDISTAEVTSPSAESLGRFGMEQLGIEIPNEPPVEDDGPSWLDNLGSKIGGWFTSDAPSGDTASNPLVDSPPPTDTQYTTDPNDVVQQNATLNALLNNLPY